MAGHYSVCVAVLVALVGCSDVLAVGFRNEPIPITVEQRVPIARVSFESGETVKAAIDTLSPFTVVSSFVADDQPYPTEGAERTGVLKLFEDQPVCNGTDCKEVTRFIFADHRSYDLRVERVGRDSGVAVRALLGYAVMIRFAVQLRYANDAGTLTFRDELPDTDDELAADCDTSEVLAGNYAPCVAVVRSGLLGGGDASIGDNVRTLPPTRIVVPLCLNPDTFDPKSATPSDVNTSGQGTSAAIYSGIGTSIIGRAAFERLRTRFPSLTETPGTTLHLPAGTVTASTTTIPRLAIVNDRTTDLGPCEELARRRRLLMAPRDGVLADKDQDQDGAAAAELSGGIEFLVVEDDTLLLSGLRTELRPSSADVDVLLAGSALERFDVDLDYPGGRWVFGCSLLHTDTCRVLPACQQSGGAGPSCR